MRNLDCSTLGKFSGHVSSGMSRIGVANWASLCSSQAWMAGQRYWVRGETYVTVTVESAVAPDPVDDQRFLDGLVGQQFGCCELEFAGWSSSRLPVDRCRRVPERRV